MNLISCDNCGIVLDKDKLKFPEDKWEDRDDKTKMIWNGDDFTPFIDCPVCKKPIMKEDYDR